MLPTLHSSRGQRDPHVVCPRDERPCPLWSGPGSILSLGFGLSLTDGPLTHSNVPGCIWVLMYSLTSNPAAYVYC